MLEVVGQIALLGMAVAVFAATIAAVRVCGAKVLLVIPAAIVLYIIGAIADAVLWSMADGLYADSDTIIFGPPRLEGSADGWYVPVAVIMKLSLGAVWLAISAVALRPKRKVNRLAAQIVE
jgi:nitrogen fixation-related uncharacterized protein